MIVMEVGLWKVSNSFYEKDMFKLRFGGLKEENHVNKWEQVQVTLQPSGGINALIPSIVEIRIEFLTTPKFNC